MTQLCPGDHVRWKNCPPSIWMFGDTKIKAIDGDYAELHFIRGKVPIADLIPINPSPTEAHFWAQYPSDDDIDF